MHHARTGALLLALLAAPAPSGAVEATADGGPGSASIRLHLTSVLEGR